MTGAPPVVALFGATALGKSDVALELAESLTADIVVADSMQIYAGLPIITNQPSAAAAARVRYHLVGWASPQEEHSVASFARRAHRVLDEQLAAGRRVVVEGGSGLYVRAALGDLAFGAPPSAGARADLEARWRADRDGLIAELRQRAPQVAARIDLQNSRRVIRALEALSDGTEGFTGDHREGERRTAAAARLWSAEGRHSYRLVALMPSDDRASLVERIDRRVDEMLAAGALEEICAVRSRGPFSRTAAQAIGVRELCAVIDGELSLDEARARMKTRTRALARRQLTWLRKLPGALRIAVDGRPPAAVAADILRRLNPADGVR